MDDVLRLAGALPLAHVRARRQLDAADVTLPGTVRQAQVVAAGTTPTRYAESA
jgi:hypothetical protein